MLVKVASAKMICAVSVLLTQSTLALNVKYQFAISAQRSKIRKCGPVVRALALRSGDPGFKTRSDHWLNLFLVVPGSTSQLHL